MDDTSCQDAFEKAKAMLCDNNVLVPYDPRKPIELQVDGSPYGVGAILSHVINVRKRGRKRA